MEDVLGFLRATTAAVSLVIDGKPVADPGAAILVAATKMLRAGVTPHERIALVPSEGLRLNAISGYLGALTIGATPVLLRPRDQHAQETLERMRVTTVVAPDLTVTRLGSSVSSECDEALVAFTSGTSTRPKGVRFSGGALRHNLDATQSYLKLTPTDSVGLPLPIHYVYGLSMLNLATRTGATVVACNYSVPPVQWLDEVGRQRCTILALLPHQVRLLLRSSAFDRHSLSQLRAICVAGGGLEEAVVRELASRFEDTNIYLMYGQTEAGPRISYLPPEDLTTRPGSIGRGIPGWTQLRLADESLADLGEIQVRSKSLMLGYLEPDDQAPITGDGWLATGDLGRQDRDGYYYVLARSSPFFKPFGERVPFAELVDVMSRLEPDSRVRLERITDPVLGESIRLHVTLPERRSDVTASHLKHQLQRHVGLTRAPRQVVLHFADDRIKLA